MMIIEQKQTKLINYFQLQLINQLTLINVPLFYKLIVYLFKRISRVNNARENLFFLRSSTQRIY